jgi:hypothetical protein
MDNYCFTQFNSKFADFIYNLNKTFKNDNELEEFNKKIEKVNPKKLIKRFIKILQPYKNQVENKDDTIFLQELYIIPNVNISRLYNSTNSKVKDVIWQYLQILYVLGEIFVTGKVQNISMLDNMLNTNININNQNTNINNQNTDDQNALDINNIMKNMNVDKLNEQLTGISKEDIMDASENIKKMFPNNTKTSNVMCDLVNDISKELANNNANNSNNNGIMGILKIAENVADKFKPKIESGEININELLGSAQEMMSEIYGKSDNNNNNPMEMLTKLMSGIR